MPNVGDRWACGHFVPSRSARALLPYETQRDSLLPAGYAMQKLRLRQCYPFNPLLCLRVSRVRGQAQEVGKPGGSSPVSQRKFKTHLHRYHYRYLGR
jgi:hypothetical protein